MKNRATRRREGRRPGGSGWPRMAAIAATGAVLAVAAAIAVVNSKSVPRIASEAPIFAPISAKDPAPPFLVSTIDGRVVDSRKIGRPIVLELFATWCPHCQKETAILNALHARYGNRLEIVAVSGSDVAADGTSAASLEDVRLFTARYGVKYPIAYDAALAVAKEYLQGGFPTTLFIDSNKRVSAIETGEVSLDRLVADAKKSGLAPANN